MNIRKKGTGSWCLCSWSISRRRELEAGAFVCGDHPPKGNRELVQLCMCSRLIFPKREPEVGTTVLVVNIPQKRTGSWYYCACVVVNFPQKRTRSWYYCACVCGEFSPKENRKSVLLCLCLWKFPEEGTGGWRYCLHLRIGYPHEENNYSFSLGYTPTAAHTKTLADMLQMPCRQRS